MTITYEMTNHRTSPANPGGRPAAGPAEDATAPVERWQWRLLPEATDRQLITIVGFIAVIGYLCTGLLTFVLLVRTPLGHTWPVIIAAAGISAGVACGVLGLLGLGVLRMHRRRRSTTRCGAEPRGHQAHRTGNGDDG